MKSVLLLTVFLLLIAGCASSGPVSARYNPASNTMVYESADMNLGRIFPTGGPNRGPRVSLRGRATCHNRDCHPQKGHLFISLEKGTANFRIHEGRSVRMNADQRRFSWPQEAQQQFSRESGSFSHGDLVRLSVSLSDLQTIANARSVTGTIGGESFSLSYEQRAPLRALVVRMTGSSQKTTGSS